MEIKKRLLEQYKSINVNNNLELLEKSPDNFKLQR